MKLIEVITNPSRNRACKDAILKDSRYPGGKNACGATASWYLREAGIFKPGEEYPLAHNVGKRLAALGWQLISDPRQVRAGDVCFSEDRPDDGNEWTDHVFIACTDADHASPTLAINCVDQQKGFMPHPRNLLKGGLGKTPFWYGYRAPQAIPALKDPAAVKAAFATIYREQLSPATAQLLNTLRHAPEFDNI